MNDNRHSRWLSMNFGICARYRRVLAYHKYPREKLCDPGKRVCSKGFALPAALLVLLILAVISAAMILVVSSETRIHTSDAQNTQAYYGAEAAMEKMMLDLNELYQTQQSPNVAQIQALGNSINWPSLSGITYSEYSFTVPNISGVPTSTTKT